MDKTNYKDVKLQLMRYKNILSEFGISGKEMSQMMDMKYSSYRRATMPSAESLPRWVLMFLYSHDRVLEKSTASQYKGRDILDAMNTRY
jgi:hypothetical protein